MEFNVRDRRVFDRDAAHAISNFHYAAPRVQGSQGSLLFVTYTIIQGIIGSEMLVGTGPLNGKCKKEK